MIIRAFHCQQQFVDQFVERMDANTRCFMKFQLSARWFGVRLDTLAACLVAALSLLLVGTRGQIDPSDAAFALSYCLQLTSLFQWAVRQSAEVETMMTSVERIVDYGSLPSEGQLINPEYRPPAGWPAEGRVQFNDFKLRYRPNLDLVLKGVDLSIAPQEKVGVCGRTGAGKSTLFQALLRLVERDPSGGVITIDGVDTSRLGLRDLRMGLSIIPQNPVLYSGSIKSVTQLATRAL
jgi:ATP-binding cassette subfamily C (CFTR/MRP) protein 2